MTHGPPRFQLSSHPTLCPCPATFSAAVTSLELRHIIEFLPFHLLSPVLRYPTSHLSLRFGLYALLRAVFNSSQSLKDLNPRIPCYVSCVVLSFSSFQ
jgi:hypothetical protein